MKYELTENEGLALINLGLTGIGAVERILREVREWEDARDQIRYEREMQERKEAMVERERQEQIERERQERDRFTSSYQCIVCGTPGLPGTNVPCPTCITARRGKTHFASDYENAGFSAQVLTPEEQFAPADWHNPSYLRTPQTGSVRTVRGMETPRSVPPPIPPTGPLMPYARPSVREVMDSMDLRRASPPVGEWHAPPTGSFPPTMHANAPIPGGGKIPDPEGASPDRIPMVAISEERLTMGRLAFIRLLGVWDQGFREDVPQPDRQRAMSEVANGSASYPVLRVVHDAGGLTHAVAHYLSAAHVDIPAYVAEEHGFERRVLSLTDNIVQVASLLFPDLAALYEHKNIFPDVVPDAPFFAKELTFPDVGTLPVTNPYEAS